MGQVHFAVTFLKTEGLWFAVGSADAFTAGYAQSELMVANKGFMSEQEKDNQVADH
jgi:hypothetical protein